MATLSLEDKKSLLDWLSNPHAQTVRGLFLALAEELITQAGRSIRNLADNPDNTQFGDEALDYARQAKAIDEFLEQLNQIEDEVQNLPDPHAQESSPTTE